MKEVIKYEDQDAILAIVKDAYGELYDAEKIDEYGWCKPFTIQFPIEMPFEFNNKYGGDERLRPAMLKNLENNNGWKKIVMLNDLPFGNDDRRYRAFKKITDTVDWQADGFTSEQIRDMHFQGKCTHYQESKQTKPYY